MNPYEDESDENLETLYGKISELTGRKRVN
jgi:hypothetical protein